MASAALHARTFFPAHFSYPPAVSALVLTLVPVCATASVATHRRPRGARQSSPMAAWMELAPRWMQRFAIAAFAYGILDFAVCMIRIQLAARGADLLTMRAVTGVLLLLFSVATTLLIACMREPARDRS